MTLLQYTYISIMALSAIALILYCWYFDIVERLADMDSQAEIHSIERRGKVNKFRTKSHVTYLIQSTLRKLRGL